LEERAALAGKTMVNVSNVTGISLFSMLVDFCMYLSSATSAEEEANGW
jgi:hypothetical protein